MSSLVFTHIETVNKRDASSVYRVITGAGIYDVAPNSPVAKNLDNPDYINTKLALAVSNAERIVGMSTVDHTHKCGRIDY